MAANMLLCVLVLPVCLLYFTYGQDRDCFLGLEMADLHPGAISTPEHIHPQEIAVPDIVPDVNKIPGIRIKRQKSLKGQAHKPDRSRYRQGQTSPIGDTGSSEVFRAKRHLTKIKKGPKKSQLAGTFSALGYNGPKDNDRSVKKEKRQKEDSSED